jgi:hypothetical protein
VARVLSAARRFRHSTLTLPAGKKLEAFDLNEDEVLEHFKEVLVAKRKARMVRLLHGCLMFATSSTPPPCRKLWKRRSAPKLHVHVRIVNAMRTGQVLPLKRRASLLSDWWRHGAICTMSYDTLLVVRRTTSLYCTAPIRLLARIAIFYKFCTASY